MSRTHLDDLDDFSNSELSRFLWIATLQFEGACIHLFIDMCIIKKTKRTAAHTAQSSIQLPTTYLPKSFDTLLYSKNVFLDISVLICECYTETQRRETSTQ